jgi:hypothetical protein
MKIANVEIANKWVGVGAAVLAVIIVLVILSVPKSCVKPSDTTAAIAAVKVELEKQYTAQIETQETQIKDYKNRLTLSEGKYKTLVSQYVDLERRKKDVIPPTTNKELRDRFTALGYPPLAAK